MSNSSIEVLGEYAAYLFDFKDRIVGWTSFEPTATSIHFCNITTLKPVYKVRICTGRFDKTIHFAPIMLVAGQDLEVSI